MHGFLSAPAKAKVLRGPPTPGNRRKRERRRMSRFFPRTTRQSKAPAKCFPNKAEKRPWLRRVPGCRASMAGKKWKRRAEWWLWGGNSWSDNDKADIEKIGRAARKHFFERICRLDVDFLDYREQAGKDVGGKNPVTFFHPGFSRHRYPEITAAGAFQNDRQTRALKHGAGLFSGAGKQLDLGRDAVNLRDNS